MDFNTTIDIILKDLRDVREIIEDLKNYPGLPQLQIELAKSKCRSAEEVIALLKTLKPVIKEVVATSLPIPPAETVIEKKRAPEKKEHLIEITSDEEEVNDISDSNINSENKIIHEPPAGDRKSTSTIIADRFTGPSGTISDKFESIKKEDDLASVIKRSKPVDNLADAIGINDKFLFIREIFNGNNSEYEQAVDKLNRTENLQDAKAIIMSYTGENDESEVVRQLLEIVKRKLPSDG
jgi:hypothetical protein